MSDILSPSIVIDACTGACKSMKLISKQLITFSSIYSRTPPSNTDSEIPGLFSELFSKISEIQDILNKLNVNTKLSIEPSNICLLYTSPSPRDQRGSRMPSSA